MKFRSLVTAMILILILSGCNSRSDDFLKNSHAITSINKEVQFNVPTVWKETNDIIIDGLVTAINAQNNKFIFVERTERNNLPEGTTVEQYMEGNNRNGVWQIRNHADQNQSANINIDSVRAFMDEGEINVPKLQSTYFLRSSFEKEHHFYSITLISMTEISDVDRNLFASVIPTLKVLNDTPEQLNTKTVTLDNDTAEIALPSTWEVDATTQSENDMYATDPEGNQSGSITRLLKSDFPDEWPTTLQGFAEVYRGTVQEEYDEVTLSDLVDVVVDGHQGTQFEYEALVNGNRLAYLSTIVEYDNRLVIIEFSTWANRFEAAKQAYLQYIQSYHDRGDK